MDITNGIILFVIAFVMIGWTAYFVFKAKKALKWPTTEGTMNSCEIKEEVDSENSSRWIVVTDYSYKVFGRTYHGKRIAFNYGSNHPREKQLALYEKLSKAKTVRVRYNPENPSDSVLSYGLSYTTFLPAGFAILSAFLIGSTMLHESLKNGEKFGLLSILFVILFMLVIGFMALFKNCNTEDEYKLIVDRIEVSSWNHTPEKPSRAE